MDGEERRDHGGDRRQHQDEGVPLPADAPPGHLFPEANQPIPALGQSQHDERGEEGPRTQGISGHGDEPPRENAGQDYEDTQRVAVWKFSDHGISILFTRVTTVRSATNPGT